jgi:hypothetical protein
VATSGISVDVGEIRAGFDKGVDDCTKFGFCISETSDGFWLAEGVMVAVG